MNTTLSNQQISFYQENGFLVIDQLLSRIELASWREAVDEAVKQQLDQAKTHNQSRGESYYKYVFIQCVNLWKKNEKIRGNWPQT